MKNPSNIPSELASSPSTDLKYNPQDPEMAELVKGLADTAEASKGFVADKQNDTEEEIKGKIDIPPNPEFSQDPSGQTITEALVPVDNILILDVEKEMFLKAVLNDRPVQLSINLYKGQFKVDLRSRSTFEQKRIFDVLAYDQKENFTDKSDLALLVTRLQFYLASIMVERINGQLFSELTLVPGKTVEEDAKTLRAFVAEKLEKMTQLRWNSVLNALRIFENKCARLNSEAANENFWNPPGSGL